MNNEALRGKKTSCNTKIFPKIFLVSRIFSRTLLVATWLGVSRHAACFLLGNLIPHSFFLFFIFLKSRKINIHYTTAGRAFSNKNMRQGIALLHCRICLCTRVTELFTPFQWWFQKEQHSWGKASLLSSDQVAVNANQCHLDWNRSQLQACDSDWKVFSHGSPTWPSCNFSLYFKIQ